MKIPKKWQTRFFGIQFHQYRLVISSISVGDFRMSAKRICIIYMHVLSNSSIPIGDLANTGWRFGQYRLAIWPIPANVRFPKGQVRGRNRGFLELCLDMESRIKKKHLERTKNNILLF